MFSNNYMIYPAHWALSSQAEKQLKAHILQILIIACCVFLPHTLLAADKVDLSNYAYSIYLGSGAYSASDRNVGILNIPMKFELIPQEDNDWSLNLNLPFAVGLYDFKNLPIDSSIPDRVETITLLPGLELPYQATMRWLITPFLDIGAGKNLNNSNLTLIYGVGMKSLYKFPLKDLDFELANRFLYAGNEAHDTKLTHDFRAFETIITASYEHSYKIDQRPLVSS